MTSIFASNPFFLPAVASHGTAPEMAGAVAPLQSADTSGKANDFSGSNSGFRDGRNQHATNRLIQRCQRTAFVQPSNATSRSIVEALTHDGLVPDVCDEHPFGPRLPKVAMPDPLPTSPFLKPA